MLPNQLENLCRSTIRISALCLWVFPAHCSERADEIANHRVIVLGFRQRQRCTTESATDFQIDAQMYKKLLIEMMIKEVDPYLWNTSVVVLPCWNKKIKLISECWCFHEHVWVFQMSTRHSSKWWVDYTSSLPLTLIFPILLCNAAEVSYLHDSYVIWERSDSQPFDHDVWQVVRVQHQVVPAVLQELLIILALILPHVAHCP